MTVNFSHIRWLSFYKFFNPNYISKRCSESLILSEILFGCHGMAPHLLTFFVALFERIEGWNITFMPLCCPVTPVLPIIFNLFSNKES